MIKSQKARKRFSDSDNGSMRTPIRFYSISSDSSIDGRDKTEKELFKAYGEIYSPSNKDRTIMNEKGVHNAVAVRIRDPLSGYHPSSEHFAKLDDVRYQDNYWQVVDFRPDFNDRRFLVVILGGDNL